MSSICHLLGDSKYGGGSKVVLGLCGKMISEGHDVFIVTTDLALEEEIKNVGGEPVRIDCIRRAVRPLWDLVGLIRLVRHLRRAKYDLVHTHTSKAGMIGRLACRMARVPAVIHTVHGFAFHEQSRPAVVSLLSLLEHIAASWCDRIVTVSRFHRAWALRLGIAEPDKIIAIPNGIDSIPGITSERRLKVREQLGIAHDQILILGLGRLAEQKGFEDLLKAVPVIQGLSTKGFKVVIAGEGPKRADLEAMIDQLSINESVELIGFSSDISGLFGAADLVVQPSLWEGLSISLLEAMSAGKAVVTTTIESNIEVVGETGCASLVPVNNPKELAATVADLMGDEVARSHIEAKAREVYEAEYTCTRMHDNYAALYGELLRPSIAVGEGAS